MKYKTISLVSSYLFIPLGILAIFLIFLFRHNSFWQSLVIYSAVLTYLVLALVHHYFDKTLTLEVFLEYILLATLVLVLLSNLLI